MRQQLYTASTDRFEQTIDKHDHRWTFMHTGSTTMAFSLSRILFHLKLSRTLEVVVTSKVDAHSRNFLALGLDRVLFGPTQTGA